MSTTEPNLAVTSAYYASSSSNNDSTEAESSTSTIMKENDSPELGPSPDKRHPLELGARFLDPYVIIPQHNLANDSDARSTVINHVLNLPQETGGQVLLTLEISNIVNSSILSSAEADMGAPAEAPSATSVLKSRGEIRKLTPSERFKAIKANESITEAIATASNANAGKQRRAGFCDLPLELRTDIYKRVFVAKDPIDFLSRQRFANSGQFLYTCRMVYNEGRPFLYGDNVFHFERTVARRGRYFSRTWEEVGWEDIRCFLEAIGPKNLKLLKRISLDFSDSLRSSTPSLEPQLRRFVNQATVHHCLNIIGEYAKNLEKVSMCIHGRRNLEATDVLFIRALKSIKAKLVHGSGRQYHWEPSKVRADLLSDILNAMTKPADGLSPANYVVRMYCEKLDCKNCVSS